MSALRDAALDYARRGFKVFPLAPRSKVPRKGSHGFKDATSDLNTIADWWDAEPNANIGIATGHDGVFVVDVDPGKGGRVSIEKLRPKEGWPRSLFSKTGSGGMHYFFRSSTPVESPQSVLPGVDIRGRLGYVVAPPSIHPSGGVYEWATNEEIAEAPASLVEAIVAGEQKPSGMVEAGETIPEGKRDDALTAIAGSLRRAGMDAEEIYDALGKVNRRRCVPPKPDSDLRRIAKSIGRYEMGPIPTMPEPPVGFFDGPDIDEPPEPVVDYSPTDYSHLLPAGKTVVEGREREPGEDDGEPDKVPTLRERVMALGSMGPKLATEIKTFDDATRGGLRAGLNVIGGPPGSGKTGVTMNVGNRMSKRGVPVTVLAADEAPSGLLIRLGQAAGFNREKLEAGDRATVEAFAASIEEPSDLELLDGDSTTVEQAAESLLARAGDKLGVLVVDSLQTVRAEGTDGAEPRARVDAVVRALKSIARRGVCVIATSEVSRGFYRSRKVGEAIDGLAAFKESGGVEFGCDVALVMRSVEGQNGVADVEIVKNRLGKKEKFRLSLNFETATFVEVSVPEEDGGPDPADTLAADMTRVRTALAEHPDGVKGLSEVFLLVRGINNARKSKATEALMAMGEIRVAEGRPKNRPLWFWQPPAS